MLDRLAALEASAKPPVGDALVRRKEAGDVDAHAELQQETKLMAQLKPNLKPEVVRLIWQQLDKVHASHVPASDRTPISSNVGRAKN